MTLKDGPEFTPIQQDGPEFTPLEDGPEFTPLEDGPEFTPLTPDSPNVFDVARQGLADVLKTATGVFTGRPNTAAAVNESWENAAGKARETAGKLVDKLELIVPGHPAITAAVNIPHVAAEIMVEGMPLTPAEIGVAYSIGAGAKAFGPIARATLGKMAQTPQGKKIAEKVLGTLYTPLLKKGKVNVVPTLDEFLTTQPLTEPNLTKLKAIREYYDNNIKGVHQDILGNSIEFKDHHLTHFIKVKGDSFSTSRARFLPKLVELVKDPDRIHSGRFFSPEYGQDSLVYLKVFTNPETGQQMLLAARKEGESLIPLTSFEPTGKQLENIVKGDLLYERGAGLTNRPGSGRPAWVTEDSTARNLPQQDVGLRATSKPDELMSTPGEAGDNINIAGKTPEVNPPGLRERKFITTVRESPQTSPEVAQAIKSDYIPRSNDELSRTARDLIATDIDAARNLALTGASDDAVATGVNLVKHYQDKGDFGAAIDIIEQMAPNLTEMGRAVQAASLYNRLSPDGIVRYAQRVLAKSKSKFPELKNLTPEQAEGFHGQALAIRKMPDGIDKAMATKKMIDSINDLVPSTLAEKGITLWKAGLLTGLKTSGVNTVSNLVHGVAEIAKDIPATAVDSVASLFTRERAVSLNVRGTGAGLKEGFEKGWRFLRTGFDERNMLEKYDYKRVNFGNSKIAKALQAYEETVFRIIGAQDQPFYYAQKARSIYEQAKVAAMNQKLTGSARAKFIDDFVGKPADDVLKNAVNDAQIAVFQNKTYIGNAAQMLKSLGPAGDIIAPFRQTPAAVATQTLNYSPFGAVKTIVQNIGKGRFNQRDFSKGMGRAITGTGLFAIGAALTYKGMMTLNAPKSEKERRLWELEGRKPNSIKMDGKWRLAGALGPIGLTMLVGGHYAQAYRETGSKTAALTKAVAGLGRSVIDQTMLKGISGALDAINDPDRFAGGFVSNLAGSIVPTIVSDVARATDSLQRSARDKNSVMESSLNAIRSRVPGLRQDLPPRRNTSGEAIVANSPAGEMIDIFRSSPVKGEADTVVKEMRRMADAGMNVTPTMITQNEKIAGTQVKLSLEQLDAAQQNVGRAIRKQYESIIKSLDYQEIDDENKKKLLDSAASDMKKVEMLKYAHANKLISLADYGVALSKLSKPEYKYFKTGDYEIKPPTISKNDIIEALIRRQFGGR